MPFDLTSGERQGCPLSPVLFNFVIDYIMKRAVSPSQGVAISPDVSITDLKYADDIAILAESQSGA